MKIKRKKVVSMKYYEITVELLEWLYLGASESLESLLTVSLQTQGVAADKNNDSPVTNSSIQFILYIGRSKIYREVKKC